MHMLRYAEMLQDSQKEARDRERDALDHSISLMERADSGESDPADVANAIVFTGKLWSILVEDLAAPGNGLPRELRAQLVSIGIWILRELESIRNEPERRFGDVIQTSRAIRDGLL